MPRYQKHVGRGRNGRNRENGLPEAADNLNWTSRGRYGIAVVKSQFLQGEVSDLWF